MELGQYLRRCRESMNRTQPDIAKEVKIEQSYLSKLESGKSIPSNEVFINLVNTYGIDLDDLVLNLSASELSRLSEIKCINEMVESKSRRQLASTQVFLITGLVFLVLGAGLLAFAVLPDRTHETYSYRSEGILQLDEELTLYDLIYRDLDALEGNEDLLKKRKNLLSRLQQKDVITQEYKGDGYIINTDEGRRFFQLVSNQKPVRKTWNRWFFVPALMFVAGGLGCFFLAKRWNRSATQG